jgi:DNA-binding CsgD family transcriptional regulator/tetratricopeptide (TPR) repeat protein
VAGAVDETLSDLRLALELSAEADRFEIRHAIGASYGMQGRIDEAEASFRALAEESAGTPDHAKALGHLSMCAITHGDLADGARLAEQALAECIDEGYGKYLRTNLAWLLLLLGRWAEAERLIEQSIAEAVAGGDIHDECALVATAGRLAGWRGDLATAFDNASRAQRLAKRLGNPADTICATDVLALALSENDMAGEGAALLPEMLRLDVPGVEPREFSYSYVVLSEACLRAGDLAGARAAAARGRWHLRNAAYWRGALDRVEAQIDLACGDALGAAGKLRPWIEAPMPIAYEQARLLEVAADALTTIGDKAGGLARAEGALRIFELLGAGRPAERVGAWIRAHTARRTGRPRSSLPGRLTERELEILQLVVLGRTNREIALGLTISLGTAKKHVENVMAKAGASRRTELVPFAISLGVLTAEALVAGPAAKRRLPGAIPVE